MEFRKVVEERVSVRQFKADPVPEDALREMVRLAALAPSVNNSQPWKFICITNRELLASMGAAVHSEIARLLPASTSQERNKVEWFSTFFEDAPAVIAVAVTGYSAVVDTVIPEGLTHDQINDLRGQPDVQGIGATIEHLLLAAVDLGYGGCWLSGPLVARQELERLIGPGEGWRLAAMVAVGKPAGPVSRKGKKPLEEVLEFRS